jgi:hypothetical protein
MNGGLESGCVHGTFNGIGRLPASCAIKESRRAVGVQHAS